jgi:hypothetical protein
VALITCSVEDVPRSPSRMSGAAFLLRRSTLNVDTFSTQRTAMPDHLELVAGSDVDGDLDPCGWVTPDVWHNEPEGLVAVRFVCQGCGAKGEWAFGPGADLEAVTAQARVLGPHA